MTETLSRLFSGDFMAKIVKREFGGAGNNNKPVANIVFEIVEGPRSGTQVTYSPNFKTKESTKYARRDMMAAGWQGKTMATFVSDIKLGAVFPINVRIAEYEGRQWNSVNSIGNTAPVITPATQDMIGLVDSYFAEIDDGTSSHPNAPGRNDDIPF